MMRNWLFTETLWRCQTDGKILLRLLLLLRFRLFCVCACDERESDNRIVSVGGVRSEDRSVEWTWKKLRNGNERGDEKEGDGENKMRAAAARGKWMEMKNGKLRDWTSGRLRPPSATLFYLFIYYFPSLVVIMLFFSFSSGGVLLNTRHSHTQHTHTKKTCTTHTHEMTRIV